MKALSTLLFSSLVACAPVAVAPYPTDPCEYQTFVSPACGGGGYDWIPGSYNAAHIWIVPHYRRHVIIGGGFGYRPYYSPPSIGIGVGVRPVTTVRTTIIAPRPSVIVRPPVRYSPTVTRSNVRPGISVTRTRIR